ncbi:MAG: winged helix DNA-binding domain-containing protein [Actinomycetota bacterium]
MPKGRGPGDVLGPRALNRALLDRQMLLRRRRMQTLDAVERLVALQAQVPRDPYGALWTRVDGFRAEALSEAMADRRAVRMTLLRGTLHTVTARDALALRSLIQPAIQKVVFGSSPLRTLVRAGVNLDEAVEFLQRLLEDSPKTRAELVKAIAERWPGVDADSLGYAMYVIPTVQTTPRGLWNRSGASRFTTVEAWLGRPVDERGDLDALIRRYLTAFGPATVADAQYWSGLSGLGVAFERMRPSLRTFADENGRELFDVPNVRRPSADTPAPVRFLPEYDNVVIGHKDRSRIVGPGTTRWTDVGWGIVLVDGFTSARWILKRETGATTLRIEPFRRLTRSESHEVTDEGDRLAGFLTDGEGTHDVRIAAPA